MTKTLIVAAGALLLLAACEDQFGNDRLGTSGSSSNRATILHQDRPGGSDYDPSTYRRERMDERSGSSIYRDRSPSDYDYRYDRGYNRGY